MIKRERFGFLSEGPDSGRECYLYTLSSEGNPLRLVLSDMGARIYDIVYRLKSGEERSVVCGYGSVEAYEHNGYFGATIGRVGNRICKGKFCLDGKEYTLFINNMGNHLHGGEFGFDRKIWTSAANDGDEPSVSFRYTSADGEEGYPGTLNVCVKYTLTSRAGVKIEYSAVTDAPTPVNLTNHVYFNLSGSRTVGNHILTLDADRYIPTDDTLIPTGEIKSVAGTAFDFRDGKKISEAMYSGDSDIQTAGGIDHCLVFTERGKGFFSRATLVSDKSDLSLECFTDSPAVQVYSGNFLGDPDWNFRRGPQIKHGAVCLETEAMPDSINHPGFTDTVLRPGGKYTTVTEYVFREQ